MILPHIYFDKTESFFDDYKIGSRKIEDNLTLFRYICYEKIEFIRQVKLPKIELNQKLESVIIDNRNMPHLEFIMRNLILKLGDGWSHTVVCTPSNFEQIHIMCNRIGAGIKIIQINEKWKDVNMFNELMYDIDFWKSLTGESILVYQDDTIVFRNNINEFLPYDYVGAPWPGKPFGLEFGNGGFSLRRRSMVLEILNDSLLVNNLIHHLNAGKAHMSGVEMKRPAEDLFFSCGFKIKSNHLPSVEVASDFSTEHLVNLDSLGGHQFWLFDPHWIDRMLKLLDGLKPTDPEKVS